MLPRGGERGDRLTERAEALYGGEMGEWDALAWAGGFGFSKEQIRRDTSGVLATGGLEEYVRRKQAEVAGDRLSVRRIERVGERVPGLVGDEEFRNVVERIKYVAEGMELRTHGTFAPNGAPPEMRTSERRMALAVNKLISQCWEKGYCLGWTLSY